ncbi:hypothetical protein [Arthrobacter rhombi]|uniref:hypothetical protein n=1 Tax=Arthrobacter rhombi TaxID=71253 RepID=UPI003F8DA3FD
MANTMDKKLVVADTTPRSYLGLFRLGGGIAAAAILLVALTGCDSRSSMTPADIVAAYQAQPGLPVTDPEDVTERECGVVISCENATVANEFTIYKFQDVESARAFAGSLGADGHQSDWVVVKYPGAAKDGSKSGMTYASLVDSMWTDE